MHRIAIFTLLGAAALPQTVAQPAEKPPAAVDQALRARVTEFYTLMKNRDYRKGEALVAEDTKDYYYAGQKPEVHAFEILSTEFSDNLTRARVFTRCSEPIAVAGFPPGELALRVPTLWKIENGNWYLYEDPTKIANPTGLQSKVDSAMKGATAAAMPAMPADTPKSGRDVMGKVHADKQAIQLSPGAVERVSISNEASGPVTLELGYPLKGVEATLDRSSVGKGETAVLTLTAGKEPNGGFFYLRVMPTEETIRIAVQLK
jgi:hypothetical protein